MRYKKLWTGYDHITVTAALRAEGVLGILHGAAHRNKGLHWWHARVDVSL